MSAAALIKLTQNAVTGPDGEAISGVTGLAVTVDNVDNTGVASWEIELLDIPSGSALTLGLLAHSDNSATPTVNFTPDQDGGCYRIALRVWDAINRVGTATDTDIRNVVVLDAQGFASPPSQIWPLPLPPTASGFAGNKPNELNVGGQERGYAGAGTDGLLDQRFKYPTGPRAISAGAHSVGAGTIVFSNSNNVSFGVTGSTVTATITVPAQTNQTVGLYAVGNTTQNSSTTLDARTLSFDGLGAVSVGYSNGSVQISVPNVVAQTNQTVGLYAVGNTTQNSSTTLDARTISYDGLGAATVGFSNGSVQISVPTQTVQTQSLIAGLYDGANSISTGTVRLTNANGVSFSINGQTLSASVAAQTNQTVGLYALGNTTQNSSTTLDARTLSFNGLGAATVGYSNGSIQISVPTQTAQTQSLIAGVYDGANSISTGTIRFTNANGVSFSINGQTLSGSVAAQTNQTVGLYALGNTTQNSSTTLDARTLSFNGLGAATVGYSNGSIQVSVPTQTNQTVGLYGLGNTTQNSSTTLDARTLSFNGLGMITVGYSNGSIQISATQTNQSVGLYAVGNTTQNSSTTLDARTISYNGLGAATMGFSNGSVQVSVPVQTNQTVGLYALGNTTQNSSTTLDARTLSFNGLGIASVGYSNGSIQISVPSGGGIVTLSAFAVGNTTQNSSTTLDQRSLSFDGLGAVSVGFSNGSIQVSVNTQTNQTVGLYALGNTTQNSSTTLDARTVSYNGLGAVTVGYSNGSVQVSGPPVSSIVGTGGISISTNGSTISISEATLPMFEPFPFSNSSGTAPGAGTWYLQGFTLPYPMAGGRINRYMQATGTANMLLASTASFNSGSTGSRSVSFSYVNSVALYSLGAGTNSTRLESIWSNSFSVGLAQSVSVSSGGATNLSVTNAVTMSYVVSIDSLGAYTTSTLAGSTQRTTAASTMNTSGVSGATTTFSNILSGSIVIPVGLNTTLNPGIYWLGQAYSTASTTGGTSIPAASVWTVVSQYGMSATSAFTNFRLWGQTTGSSGSQFNPGEGFFSVVSGAPPTTIAFSDIRSMGSNFKQYFNIINSTLS